jgi:hypothetical protein
VALGGAEEELRLGMVSWGAGEEGGDGVGDSGWDYGPWAEVGC